MIDVHTHVVPPELPFGTFPGDHWPRVEVDGETGQVFVGDAHFRTVRSVSWDLDRRAEDMEGHGVERQVLSPMPELFCYWADGDSASDYCAAMNDWLAARVRGGGGRFDAFGIVPMQEPDRAAAMLADVAAAGLRGVEIGSNIEGVPLHDTRYADVFAEAERLGLVVFVHAFHPHLFEAFSSPPAASGVTFPNEIGLATGGLVAEGVLLRQPNLRVCASHGAGSLGLLLPRLDRMWEFDPGFAERLPERPSQLARRLFVDLLVFAPHALVYVLAVLGHDRVVVGSDYPFMPDRPGAVLEEMAALSQDDLERICTRNALALLGEDHQEDGP
ncbi:MAG TPA: amidohydrolase family protein [Acidimicrobiia bacterium]